MTKSDYEKVLEAIEDRFYEEEMLSSARDIAEWTDISESRVRDILAKMLGNGLSKIYEGSGKPTLYLTEQMKNALTAQAGEPDWIDSYEFDEKVSIREEIKEKSEKLKNFQELEGLLYSSGEPLENSVEHALDVLGFDPENTVEEEDFVIRYDGLIYIIEVKGKSGRISKSDVAQLGTWLDKWIEKEDPEKLRGVLVGNYERNKRPKDRGKALTEQAERFLNLRPAFCVSSSELFEIIKSVKDGKISEEEGREKFLEKDPGA